MRIWAILGACATVSIVAVVSVLLAAPELSAGIGLSAWGQASAEVAGAIACAVAAAHTRGRARLVWSLFALAEMIWALTDGALALTQIAGVPVDELSVLDVGWLSFYVPAGLATTLLYMRLRPERGAQGLIDGLIATIGVAAIAWTSLIGGLASSGAGGVQGTLVVALYPALDLLCVATLGWIVIRHKRRAPVWLGWVVGAFAAQSLAGIAYLVSILPGRDFEVAAAAGFMAAGWLWVMAGVARTRAPQRAWAAGTHDRPPVWSETVPFLIGMVVVGMAALRPDAELRAAAVMVVGLMAIRAMGALRVGRGLLTERDRLLVTDPLTGTYNRRFLAEETDRAIARSARSGEPLSAIALDLDHFKEVNDHLGHAIGDRLLQAVCIAISGHLRTGDVLCRLGGDEFLILCAGTPGEGAQIVAERVRLCVLETAAQVVADVPVSASLGIATYPADADGVASLLRNADTALYDAKERGRNMVCRVAPIAAGVG